MVSVILTSSINHPIKVLPDLIGMGSVPIKPLYTTVLEATVVPPLLLKES